MINICLCTDNRFAEICAVAIKSIMVNKSDDDEFTFYIINDKLSNVNKNRLEDMICTKFSKLVWIESIDMEEMLGEKINTGAWPITILQRLYISSKIPKSVERILYLDCDMLVRKSLKELYYMDLDENCYIAGVKECIRNQNKINIGMNVESHYINSGMLLVDLNQWRNIDSDKVFTDFLKKYSKRLQYPDQDILNAVFENKIKILDPKYNATIHMFQYSRAEITKYHGSDDYYTEKELEEATIDPIIVHFNGDISSIRPWYKIGSHKYRDEWLSVRNLTPWAEEPLWEDNRSFKNKLKYRLFKIFPRKFGITIASYLNRKHSEKYMKQKIY